MIDQRTRRGVVALFLVALLATPLVIRHMSARAITPLGIQEAKAAALENYGFYFEEVSHQAGIDFVHRAPTLDP